MLCDLSFNGGVAPSLLGEFFILHTNLELFSLSLCFMDKDETSSTGCISSVLVSRVVGKVPAVAWVSYVLFHIEGTSHQVVCKRGPIQ